MQERIRNPIAAALMMTLIQVGVAHAAWAEASPGAADAIGTAAAAGTEADDAAASVSPDAQTDTEDVSKPGFARSGPYVGMNAAWGMSVFNDPFKDLLSLPDIPLSSGNSPGLNARAGLRFLGFMAIEAQYEWFQGYELSFSGIQLGTLSNHTLTGNLKLFLPLWRVQPYVMGGIGASWWKTEGQLLQAVLAEKGNGFAGRAGGGVEIYLTRHLVLDVETTVVMITRDFETRDFFGTPTSFDRLYYLSTSAGLSYRF